MAESLLRTTLCNDSLYLETGLACGQEADARDRKELAPFNARPGKLFTASPAELKSIYKKIPEFVQLSKKYDPQGKFRNEFLNTNIFSS